MSLHTIKIILFRLARLGSDPAHEGFPLAEIAQAQQDETFEALHAAQAALVSWQAKGNVRACDALIAELDMQIRNLLPEYDDMGSGLVMAVPMGARSRGYPRYHSLSNAALHHGIQVSTFDRALRAVAVFDAAEAMARGTVGLAPVGHVAEYRITVLDGTLVHPPRWPADLAA